MASIPRPQSPTAIMRYVERFGPDSIPAPAYRAYSGKVEEIASRALKKGSPVPEWEELKELEEAMSKPNGLTDGADF